MPWYSAENHPLAKDVLYAECQLEQFTKCTEVGETWTYKLMNEFFAKMKSDKKKKPIEGC